MKTKILIVVANYYPSISMDLYKGSTLELEKNNLRCDINFWRNHVSGVFEIPYLISCKIKNYTAFIALGCVIKGQTPHFDFISKAVINGIMNLSITHKKPIGNGIITCLNKKQALERADPKKKDKGGEAARAVLKALNPSI